MSAPPNGWEFPPEPSFHDGEETPAPPLPEDDAKPEPIRTECWRCGKWVDLEAVFCPVCRAPSDRAPATTGDGRRRRLPVYAAPAAEPTVPVSLKAVLWMFSALLAASLCQAWWLAGIRNAFAQQQPAEQQATLITQLIVFELIDTVIVLIALAWACRPRPFHRTGDQVGAAWASAAPVLCLLVAMNWGYHQLLLAIVGRQPFFEFIGLDVRSNPALVILAICVQPALVEEFFFRYLALGHLRSVMGVHSAVWVSSLMFGMAHIHVPLSIPILILVGVGLGYMRVLSGGLAIPMLMHALHNGVVLYLESRP